MSSLSILVWKVFNIYHLNKKQEQFEHVMFISNRVQIKEGSSYSPKLLQGTPQEPVLNTILYSLYTNTLGGIARARGLDIHFKLYLHSTFSRPGYSFATRKLNYCNS